MQWGLATFRKGIFSVSMVGLCAVLAVPVAAQTVIERWGAVTAPPAPEIQDVTVDPKTTAFLVLDIQNQTCNAERRPRCVERAPGIGAFLERARAAGMMVAHSLIRSGEVTDILPPAQPAPGEPVVKSSVDKFYGTDLESLLKDRGIETVIVVGTTAEGAVLHTATGASMRGFKVVVPVDGLSAGELYAEQYTVWHLANAPGTRRSTTLSRLDMIRF